MYGMEYGKRSSTNYYASRFCVSVKGEMKPFMFADLILRKKNRKVKSQPGQYDFS